MRKSLFKHSGLAIVGFGLALQLSSCVSTDREVSSSNKDPRATYVPPTASSRARVNGRTVLNTVRSTHAFSSPNAKDNFTLQLRGERVLTGQAHLIVTNINGDTLSHEILPARALLQHSGITDSQGASVRDQEIAILQGMNSFFTPGHFSQPAVPSGTAQPAEVDTKIWTSLREDPTAVGFDFVGEGGSERRMAFSHKLGKAVVISQ